MNLLEKVENLSQKIYPKHNYEGHLMPVVRIATQLCDHYHVDNDVVIIGAYMHDSGRVRFGGLRHNVTGAWYTDAKLKSFGAPEDLRKKVVECVRSHRGVVYPSKEAEIIANADALSHYEGVLYLFAIHYTHEKNIAKTRRWVTQKLEGTRKKLTLPEAQKRAQECMPSIEILLTKLEGLTR